MATWDSRDAADGDGFRDLVENAAHGVLVHEDFVPRYANAALARMFGYRSSESILALSDVRALFAPEERDRVSHYNTRRHAEDGAPDRYELRCRREDGSELWSELVASRVIWGGRPCTQGSFLDITARRAAEEDLAASRRLLRAVIDNLPLFVFVKDLESNYIIVNQAMTEFCGLPRDNSPSTTPLSLPIESQAEREATLADDRVVLETRQPYIQPVLRVTTPSGEETFRYSVKMPLFDDAGELMGLLGVGQDITERLHLERELGRYHSDLETRVEERTRALRKAEADVRRNERLAALGQLTGSVSHELRNPLGTISASLDLIRNILDQNDDTRLGPPLARADRNMARCVRLLDSLLSFSRMGEPVLEPVAVDAWLREIVEEEQVPDAVEVRLDLASGATLALDAERMRQALSNVIQNACQAMVERADARLTIASRSAGGTLTVTVDDTGPGIAVETRERIFEPLFSTRAFGFGLGMPLVKRIVERHGGRIELGDAAGGGASVTIDIPLDGPPDALAMTGEQEERAGRER